LIDYTYNPKHWGSLLTIFRKENNKEVFLKKYSKLIDEKIFVEKYNIFRDGMSLVNRYLKTSIYPLYAYGAALTLPILAYHLQNNFSKFVAIIDDDGGKDGLYYLNLPVPIIYSSKINEDLKQAAVLISATNFSRIIINKLIGLNPKQIIIPVNIV